VAATLLGSALDKGQSNPGEAQARFPGFSETSTVPQQAEGDELVKANKDTAVFFHYQLTDDSGEVLDSSKDSEPLGYLHGHGNIINGLEEAIDGRSVGDEFVVTLEPSDAYGERDEEMVETVSRSIFEDNDEIEVGMVLRARSETGEELVTVTDIADDDVTIDANHPLAGARLTFDVEITEVRPATEEELSHGHVHTHVHHH
jgi:FKBP-type peptidyl-prolyl cis-trans isomerase SlyD